MSVMSPTTKMLPFPVSRFSRAAFSRLVPVGLCPGPSREIPVPYQLYTRGNIVFANIVSRALSPLFIHYIFHVRPIE